MKKLQNPRGYLSYTQIDLWKRSPKLYVERYIHGQAEEASASMDFGSKAALALETGEDCDDELVNMLATILPKYGSMEHEMRATLETRDGSVVLLGKLDTFDPETLSFREYKTGRNAWTQHRCDNHFQLQHYAALIWLKHRKLPPKVHLDWAETELVNGQVALTGNIKTFEVKLKLADVLSYLSLAAKVARQIDDIYTEEIKNLIS